VWPARKIGTRVDRQQAIDAEPRSIIARFSGIMALLSCESVDIFSGALRAPHNRDHGHCPGDRAAQRHLRGSAPPRAQTSEPLEKSESRNDAAPQRLVSGSLSRKVRIFPGQPCANAGMTVWGFPG
jgi:hypothetical protein